MNYQKLIEQLATQSQQLWGQSFLSSGANEFQQLEFRSVPETFNLIKLLNFIVAYMESDEIYCQIGLQDAEILTGTLLNHPNCMAYAVDRFESKIKQDIYENIFNSLNLFYLTDQVFLFDQEPQEFLFE